MNAVESLLGEETGGPTEKTPVTKDESARFEMSRTIVLENFADLKAFVDGEIENDAWIVIHDSQQPQSIARTLFQHVHNYLASLYSFNEQIRELVNNKTSGAAIEKRDFSPRKGESPATDYVEKLAFLRGLRHSMQHGDYRSLDFRPVETTNGFEFWEVTFNRQKFEGGTVNYPKSFVQYRNAKEMAKPLQYVADFHQNYFVGFTQDCIDWLNGNP
ncbi:hypothetical protein [Halorussus pelagicus]|uniref:hypothetical protein n=1 Tax=Halorussus pelagicus TaxID=2505977 RepID=UPI000FFBC829|nr:hypothetical protein [Halorussus pelagicus]